MAVAQADKNLFSKDDTNDNLNEMKLILPSPGPLTVKWAKEQGVLPPGRATDNGNGVLIITQVETSDSGSYVCTATAGQYIVTERAQLDVGAGSYDSAPRVVITPQYKQAQVGDRVRFRCEAEGTPAPSVSWRRSGGQALGSGVSSRGPVLEIRSVAKVHEGRYICVGSNAGGSRETETVLYVSESGGGTDQGWGEMGVRVEEREKRSRARTGKRSASRS